MFAKVFAQIFDSSIANDWQARLVFTDLLTLADNKGVVDMTTDAISRRTNVPLDLVLHGIAALESPDPQSRTPDHEGRRIVRLDEHRSWGWRIVNFVKYRESATKEMLRMGERERKQAYRTKFHHPSPYTPNPKRQIKEEEGEKQSCPASVPDCPGHVPDSGKVKALPDSLGSKGQTDSRQDWQLRKDREALEKSITGEREKIRPDRVLIEGFRKQLNEVEMVMRQRAEQMTNPPAEPSPKSKPYTGI